MRTNPRSITVHTLEQKKVKKNALETDGDNKTVKRAQLFQKNRKGKFILIPELPGHLLIFIPEGKNEQEIVNNYKFRIAHRNI